MEFIEGDDIALNGPGPATSPDSTSKTKLQLPLSCDPPGLSNPPKQLVWIVSSSIVLSRGKFTTKAANACRLDLPDNFSRCGDRNNNESVLTCRLDIWKYRPHGP